jgi:hypothetical protein
MTQLELIEHHISIQNKSKSEDLFQLHQYIVQHQPQINLWFFDGTNDVGKIVSNPTIGYGSHTIHYANGTSKDFFRVGMCANATGISLYIMGLSDKNFLINTYGSRLGKAKITGYCIRFTSLKNIHWEVLKEIISVSLGM